MTRVSLERIADTLYPKEQPRNSTAYGSVDSINADGSYQVKLNASATTTRCAKLCDADVGDRVLVLIQANGHCSAIGRVGGSIPTQPTFELLWTNDKPSSSFSNQTLPFDGAYDAYVITSASRTDYGAEATAMVPAGVSLNITVPYYSTGSNYRSITTTTSSIQFTGGSNSGHVIPHFIWGVRY